ncbi:MAG TPA: hypothetical protein HA292_03705 [Candidatus Nitrosotenuis sp.]|jgi:archaellum component FlaF (FlaF/FlaG flagellin family)|nr:hypothetical protein [Candidatus Nitrosotenuis sp.]HIH46173.1 hypothetical protein [Candidatus Nitrosotenuis sp.]
METTEKNPHNYRTVGYCMILVSASLVVIALLYLAIGDDVLYSDRVSKEKQFEYKQFLEEMKQKQEQASQINNPEIKNSDSMPVNKP